MNKFEPVKILAIIVVVVFVLSLCIALTSCGAQNDEPERPLDIIVKLPDGDVVTGHGTCTWGTSGVAWITFDNGTKIRTHMVNVAVIQH